ncbi:MAG TPA: hypothetical protein PKL96_09085 [Bacteroidales bacterium]|nr:hypothetical protein [Bacteroidales bacterium]HPS27657.1 hypothetical protein [Bacteroidales bacterium]
MSLRRKNKIDEILNYLEKQALQSNSAGNAVAENISFFKHTYSILSFYKWLYTIAPGIRQEDFEELMDIDSDSPYDTELIASLAATERKFFPGLTNPIVKKIFRLITEENNGLIVSLGSGAMEVERQVITKLIRIENDQPVVFIGMDKSDKSHHFAKQNLAGIKSDLDIIEINELYDTNLQNILMNRKSLYTVVLCKNDIFSFDKYFSKSSFDLAYNCFFKHHFTAEASETIDNMVKRHTKKIIDYDGVKNNFNTFVQSLFVWKNPVLLSGTVFSNLRYKKKNELITNRDDIKIKTYWMKGTYLKEINTPVVSGNH